MPFDPDGDSQPESTVYDKPPAFNPYDPPEDPEVVQPPSPGPAQSSTEALGFGDTSGADDESQEEAPQDQTEEEPLPEFDPRYREDFEGLLYLGRLEETFSLWGHTFVIRTLTTEQLAEIGQIVRPHEGSNAKNAVYQSAVVAASVVTVDGKPLPQSITIDNSDELTTVRYPYVLKKWMPPVREALYNRSMLLELKTRQVLHAMGEASG